MARQKFKIQTVIGPPKVISLDPDATNGATLGVNLYAEDGTLLTPNLFAAWIGDSLTIASGGTTNHSALQNLDANDHPQYALAAALADVAFSGAYADLTGTPTVPSTLNDLSDVNTTGEATGDVLTYNGSGWVPQAPGGGASADPIKNFRFFDHLLSELSASTFSTDWIYANSGTSSATSPNAAAADHPGVFRLTHGTSAGAFSRVFHYGDTTATGRKLVPSANKITIEWAASFQTAPTAANNYNAAVGARASFASSISVVAATLLYDGGTSSVRWQLLTRNEAGSTTTTLAGSAATIVAGQYYRVKIEIDTSTASLYVDGTLVAQHSTNLPDGGMALYAQMLQAAGAATRYMDLDWVDVQQDLSSVWP